MKNFTFCAMLICCTQLFAQNWTGNINSDWNNPANWSDNPGNGSDLIIDPINYSGAMASPVIATNSNFQPGIILVQNAGNLTINANLTTSDNVEIIGLGSEIIQNAGNFSVNVNDGGRYIADLGGKITLNNGNLTVGERFISGAESIITINGGVATTNERLLMDLGGKIILNAGVLNVGAVMALADGELTNSAYFEQNGGTLNVTGEVALENEAGAFEPTIRMTGGTFNLNGDLVWFGTAPGSGTPKVKLIGGTTNFNGNIVNLAGSTVNMHLTISDSANVQFNGTLIDQIQATDTIKQVGTGNFTFNTSATWNNLGVFVAQNTTTNFNGNTILNGTGQYQFSSISIENLKTLTQQNPTEILLNGNFTNNGTFVPQLNTVKFNGSQNQFVNGLRTSTFYNFTLENSSTNGLYLDTTINISGHLNLVDGYLYSSLDDKLILNDNATSSQGSDLSFVNGPLTKLGNDTFIFPLGKNGTWRRLEMSSPINTTSSFEAEYFYAPAPAPSNLNPPIEAVSATEYWSFNRITGTDEVQVKLYWEDASSSGINCDQIAFAAYDGLLWNEIASTISSACLPNSSGTINSLNPLSTYNFYTFGSLGNITVNHVQICEGSSLTVGSNTYTQTGTYTDVFTGSNNEDSTIVTNLSVQAAQTINQTINLCPTQTYTINGNTYSTSGIYTDLMSSSIGCDSTVITTIILNQNYSISNPQTICEGQTYVINGNSYATAGTYTDVFQSISGCDSTITTILTVNPSYSISNPQTICEGETYEINGNSYDTAGTYTDVLQSISGCDSTITTIITVNPSYSVSNPQTICAGESYTINGNSYTSAGIYTDIMQTINGCDSTVITNLTVENVNLDLTVTQNNSTLTALENNATYQWLDCSLGNAAVLGATGQSFTATETSFYAVEITSLNCNVIDTSICISVAVAATNEISKNTLSIHPNPSSDNIQIHFENQEFAQLKIFDIQNKLIHESKIQANEFIDISQLETGIYYFVLNIDKTDQIIKFVKL